MASGEPARRTARAKHHKTFRRGWGVMAGSNATPGKYVDPCEAEAKDSFSCLERQHGKESGKSECENFFETYRECRRKVAAQMKEERLKAQGGSLW